VTYLVFDWETTGLNKGDDYVGKPSENGKAGGPSPWHPLNKGVSVGWTTGGEEGYGEAYGYHCNSITFNPPTKNPLFYEQATRLIGHNIRFDLAYTMKHYPDFYDWIWDNDIQIWDTQQAEYLLSGQRVIMPSLQQSCERNNLEGKHDEVSEMFKQGIQAQDIDPEILLKYMKQDVLQTEALYLKQRAKAEELGMLPLIESQMQAMLCTFEMQLNGMCFDYDLAQEYATEIRSRQTGIEEQIFETYQRMHPEIKPTDISTGSNDFLSRSLFSGPYKYKERIDTGELYKNGNPKLRTVTQTKIATGLLQKAAVPDKLRVAVKKQGFFEVNDDILKRLKGLNAEADALITAVLSYRQNNKDISTYYQGFSDMCYPEGGLYFIHGNLNHAVTATGRLSSSKPNLQNLSGKER
jgi:DNA polymerase I-like protein with 3'-5' exonuclease and polymerase domains